MTDTAALFMIYSQGRILDGSDTYSTRSDAWLIHRFCFSRCNSRPDSEPYREGRKMTLTEPENPSELVRALGLVIMSMFSGFYIGWLLGIAMAGVMMA